LLLLLLLLLLPLLLLLLPIIKVPSGSSNALSRHKIITTENSFKVQRI
jgi:hypothetical protein